MTIDGVSGRTAYIASSLSSLKSQLETLTGQLSSGRKSTTYAGLGVDAGTATGLRAQISTIAAYSDTATILNTRINVANLSLQGISNAGINYLALPTHLEPFFRGLVASVDIVYFLLIIAVALALATRRLDALRSSPD